MPSFSRLLVPIVLVLLLALLAVDLGRLVLAPTREASVDAIRIRNAMVAEMGSAEQTRWQPGGVPEDFRWESMAAPGYFTEVVQRVLPAEASQEPAFQSALRIARHLRENARHGAPIQSNTRETYEKIVAGEGGYCSDYTQSFNALALAAGLEVREWGFAWSDMANGHAFNEVWEPALGKWIFIDSFVSFYAVDAVSGEPLSALELREALLGEAGRGAVRVERIVPERFGFKTDERALEWYRKGVPQMFLVQGNSVFSYDDDPVVQLAGALPRSVEMTLAILLGEHPRFLFVPAPSHPELVEKVEAMRWELAWVLAKIAAAGVIALALLTWLWRGLGGRKRRPRTA